MDTTVGNDEGGCLNDVHNEFERISQDVIISGWQCDPNRYEYLSPDRRTPLQGAERGALAMFQLQYNFDHHYDKADRWLSTAFQNKRPHHGPPLSCYQVGTGFQFPVPLAILRDEKARQDGVRIG